jgi:hypothetical protein
MNLDEKDVSCLQKFLSDLQESIKNGTINNEEILLLCEFHYKFKFSKENQYNKKDLVKYLSLGYYIYSLMEKED